MKLLMPLVFRPFMIFSLFIIAQAATGNENDPPTASTSSIQWIGKDSVASINPGVRLQNVAYFKASEDELSEAEAERVGIRRFRLSGDGFVLTPRLTYKVQADLSESGASLIDASISYSATENLQLSFGRAKVPANRERLYSSSRLAFAERSLGNDFVDVGRDFGFFADYNFTLGDQSNINLKGMLGGETGGTARGQNGVLYAGRVDFEPFGEFASFTGGGAEHYKEPKAAFGAYISHMPNDIADIAPIDTTAFLDQEIYGADFSFKYQGFSLMGAWGNRTIATEDDIFGEAPGITTFSAETGYLVSESFEPMIRYVQGTDNDENTLESYSLALNYYLDDHSTKAQLELTHNDGEINFPMASGDYFIRSLVQFSF